ncbi:MAG: SusC/RagA family TonB-linked outer membrane protein [Bacteroidales bacterium]|nr:SusC/RagA family TonB-linked outer membrane protein [Candidatus Colimorpha onthohippi]
MRKQLFIILFLFVAVSLTAQNTVTKVSGVVKSSDDGLPMIGATVLVSGTTYGTVTDVNGAYTLNDIPNGAQTITFSYAGYAKQVLPIAPVIDVVLKPSSELLREVVVTAMAVKRERKSLGYTVQHVDNQELTEAATLQVGTALQGKMAGVEISQSGGAIGASQRITIRGSSSFNNNAPLIVVDGVPYNNDATSLTLGQAARSGFIDGGNGLQDLNPEDIADITVLKGGSAALYGMRAGNGVLLITTKKGASHAADTTNRPRISYDGSLTIDHVYSLLPLQNKYGQGLYGSEYYYNKLKSEGYFANPDLTYLEFCAGNWQGAKFDEEGVEINADYLGYGFRYVDGVGGGLNDGVDESWGPRLDIGVKLPQYNSYRYGVEATDWVSHPDNLNDFFQLGISQNHVFSISNSSSRGSYRASLGYRGQTGIVPNTDMERYNASLSGNFIFNSHISFDGSLYFTHNHSNNLLVSGYCNQNPLVGLTIWTARQIDMQDLKDNYQLVMPTGAKYNWISIYSLNPYLELNNNSKEMDRNRLFGKGSLWVTATPWLKFEGRVGYDLYHNQFELKYLYDYDYINGLYRITNMDNQELNMDALAYVDHDFGQIDVHAIAGANYYDALYSYCSIGSTMANGLTVPGLYSLSNVSGSLESETDHSHIRSNSLYANVQAGWRHQLFLEGSMRHDWHSAISKSFFYPSVNSSWVVTETFSQLKSVYFNYLKLRFNWANIGNSTIAYNTKTCYEAVASTISGVNQYSLPSTLLNPDINPENINTTEVGFESAFLDNRLRIDVSYYWRRTSDQILTVQIPASSGYSYKLLNAGVVDNKGIEVMMQADILQRKEGLNWTTAINFSRDKSLIVSLADGMDAYYMGNQCYAMPGRSFGTIVGSGLVYNDKGQAIVGEDGRPLSQDNVEIGNIAPDFYVGWHNEFKFRQFSFGFLLHYRHGGDVLSYMQAASTRAGSLEYTVENNLRETGVVFGQNVYQDISFVNADGSANTTVVDPKSAFERSSAINELNVFDGSYLKLREMHLTYHFPQRWLKKMRIVEGASVSIVANNFAILWLHKSNLTHTDPECASGTSFSALGYCAMCVPPTRSIGLKLHLSF